MYEARRLLLDTDMPAREIAEHLGFSSAAYFTRAFTQATGRTPSDFRAPHAGREGPSHGAVITKSQKTGCGSAQCRFCSPSMSQTNGYRPQSIVDLCGCYAR
jgi:AraC-like DNA-binding protein